MADIETIKTIHELYTKSEDLIGSDLLTVAESAGDEIYKTDITSCATQFLDIGREKGIFDQTTVNSIGAYSGAYVGLASGGALENTSGAPFLPEHPYGVITFSDDFVVNNSPTPWSYDPINLDIVGTNIGEIATSISLPGIGSVRVFRPHYFDDTNGHSSSYLLSLNLTTLPAVGAQNDFRWSIAIEVYTYVDPNYNLLRRHELQENFVTLQDGQVYAMGGSLMITNLNSLAEPDLYYVAAMRSNYARPSDHWDHTKCFFQIAKLF